MRLWGINKILFGWLSPEKQDGLGMLRRYSLFGQRGKGNAIVSMIDGSTFHGGLTDRWKGIVSLYALCKAIGRDFRIHYTYPFPLTMFQEPNTYDWRIGTEELSRNLRTTRMLRLTADPTLNRVMHLPMDKQIHCYANRDWLPIINSYFGTSFQWGELFNELFRPTPMLQKTLGEFTCDTDSPYIAVALRMQNLFGDYPEYQYQPTTKQRQEQILQACIDCIKHIHDTTSLPILVTSDSKRVTDYLLQLPYVFSNTHLAAHVDTLSHACTAQYLKSFVDFYLLAGATTIYAPHTPEMYLSDFPQYAAKSTGKDFLRIDL